MYVYMHVYYFLQRKSKFYLCGLNVVKAFDRINLFYLLSCLSNRGVPWYIVNALHAWLR